MRRWIVGATANQYDAAAYEAALDDLRSVVHDAIIPSSDMMRSRNASWNSRLTSWLWSRIKGQAQRDRDQFATDSPDTEHITNPELAQSIAERLLRWMQSSSYEKRERAPHTLYDTPEPMLWPDWDYDQLKAKRAFARKHRFEILNGWEQAMWGPFVPGIQDTESEQIRNTLEPYRASLKHSALITWLIEHLTKWTRPNDVTGQSRPVPGQSSSSSSGGSHTSVAKTKRDQAIKTLEQIAFTDRLSEEDMLNSAFQERITNTLQSDALWVLGEHSLWGTHGAEPDLHRAIDAFERLAKLGNATAHARLGSLYNNSLVGMMYGVQNSKEQALIHTVFAAQEGVRSAQMSLAHQYHYGLGVPTDCRESLHWYDTAAREAYSEYLQGPPGGRRLPYGKLSLAERRSISIDRQNIVQIETGYDKKILRYRMRRPKVERILGQGLHLLDDAASLRDLLDTYAHYQGPYRIHRLSIIAHALYRGSIIGEGVPLGAVQRDFPLAMRYALQAAEIRWPYPAKQDYPGWGPKNPDGSFQRAYLANEVEAHDRYDVGDAAALLGMMYLRGEGAPQDLEAAKVWFTRAIIDRNSRASAWLATMAEEGWAGERDLEQAKQFLQMDDSKMFTPDIYLATGKSYLHSKLPEKALQKITTSTSVFYLDDPRESGFLETSFEAHYLTGSIYADWTYDQKKPIQNCRTAIEHLKKAVELADWADPIFHRAETAYSRGDLRTSLMAWSFSAAQGVREAQESLAYVFDPFKSYLHPTLPRDSDRTSLEYWARSAEQDSSIAVAKVCDFLSSDRGVVNGSSQSAACFLSFAESDTRLIAPHWRLAHIYESGRGVAQRDFPLAKRYYDKVAALNPSSAILTAFPALILLHFKALWLWIQGDESAGRLFATYFGKTALQSSHTKPSTVMTKVSMDFWLDYLVDAGIFVIGLLLLGGALIMRRYLDARLQAANDHLARVQALR
ncbi:ERAD-associated protein [Malassezia psittaci]|uniref:ERAD-associated protein n=1 Tax=Malassezia psittaci TaxID=1821823 RepID=A0AAF0JF32_9BASI|nr:ERAD-associated protein [Malassezia psittaci]